MFRQVVQETFAEPYCEEELLQEMSCFYKNKLFQHFHRYIVVIMIKYYVANYDGGICSGVCLYL